MFSASKIFTNGTTVKPRWFDKLVPFKMKVVKPTSFTVDTLWLFLSQAYECRASEWHFVCGVVCHCHGQWTKPKAFGPLFRFQSRDARCNRNCSSDGLTWQAGSLGPYHFYQIVVARKLCVSSKHFFFVVNYEGDAWLLKLANFIFRYEKII